MTNYVIRKEQCPACARKGNDRARDNLAVYSDGGVYCFSCGYSKNGNGISSIKTGDVKQSELLAIPSDATDELDTTALRFLGQYGITSRECALNTIMYSEFWKRLIFPYFNSDGLVAWQGRYLGQDSKAAKWYSKGNLRELVHLLGNSRSSVTVLCEDILSAIKIARNPAVRAMPLFGSHVSMSRIMALKNHHNTKRVLIWLDKDKMIDSTKYARQVRQVGIECSSVITELDPKCYSTEEIMEITNG